MVRRHLPALLSLSVVTLAAAVLFWPLVWGLLTGQPRWFEWDVPEQYWPDLVFLCDNLHQGQIPLWNPHDRFGYPYFADPQAGSWLPLNWGLCAVAGPSPGPGWAVWRVVLGFWLAGALGLLWLRELRIPWHGATAGAVLLMAAPFMRHNWELNLTLGLALAPGILWALDRARRTLDWKDGVLLGMMWGLCAQVGSPPALWQATSFALLYGAWRVVGVVREQGRAALLPGLLTLGAAATVAGLLSAVVLLPTMSLAEHTVQQGHSLADISAGGLDPSWLLALVWPRPGNHLFLGLLPLILGGWALARRPWERWPLLALAVLSVLMTLGEHTPLFGLAFDWVPGVSTFRLPHRYEAWLGLAAAPLVGWGLTHAAARLRRPRWELALGAAAAGVILFDASRVLPADRHTRAGPHPGTQYQEVLSRLEPGARVFAEFGISCRSGTRLGLYDGRGYQDPLLLHHTERVWARLREDPGLLERLGVRYVLTGPHFIHRDQRNYLPPAAELLALPGAMDLGAGVIELTRSLTLASWTDGRQRRAARVRHLESDLVVVEVAAPLAGELVVHQAWYPGWRAWVDGEEVEVRLADDLVQAVSVPAGDHTVELRFLPRGRHLRWLWLAGWLACAAAAITALVRRRRGGKEV